MTFVSNRVVRFRQTTWFIVLTLAAIFCANTRADIPTPVGPGAPNLRTIKTRHYEIHTDLQPALANELAQRMDVMYDQYVQQMKEFKPATNTSPLLVFLFAKREDYMALTHFMGRNTGGMFVAAQTPFLAAYEEGQGRDALRHVLQHEAFHQFAWFTISKNLPIWLNEGLAQMFEEGIWTGHNFILGQVPPRRIRQLQADAKDKKLVDFTKFLAVTPQEWSENLNNNLESGTTYYNQAWAMVYFLTEGGVGNYRNQFIDYMKKLHSGDEPEAAFKQAFPGGISNFQDAFSKWGASLHPTPEAMMLEHMDVLGDMLEAVSHERNAPTTMVAFRSLIIGDGMEFTYTRGNVRYHTDPPQTYFSNMNGKLYSSRDLYFQLSPESTIPDIVLHPNTGVTLRTHFYKAEKRTEHEVLIEAQ